MVKYRTMNNSGVQKVGLWWTERQKRVDENRWMIKCQPSLKPQRKTHFDHWDNFTLSPFSSLASAKIHCSFLFTEFSVPCNKSKTMHFLYNGSYKICGKSDSRGQTPHNIQTHSCYVQLLSNKHIPPSASVTSVDKEAQPRVMGTGKTEAPSVPGTHQSCCKETNEVTQHFDSHVSLKTKQIQQRMTSLEVMFHKRSNTKKTIINLWCLSYTEN